jgi:nucleoside-diphosphate-sugar epimerase
MLVLLVGYKGAPKYLLVRKGEICRISLACGKAKDIWGWQPSVSVTEGLSQTVNYYK